MITLDEAIWREVALAQSFRQRIESTETTDTTPLEECETEHRQLAKWLRELKAYKEDMHSCEHCKYEELGASESPCIHCRHNHEDLFEWRSDSDDK